MKKTLIVLVLVICQVLITQVQAQSFNYQAVVRDASNTVVVNQSIGVQLKIIEGSPTGTIVYTETHLITSNGYGVITLSVGAGTTTDTFSTINWSLQNQWLAISVDISGGISYVAMGTSKLQHVPYSSYAKTSGDKAFSTNANVTSNTPGVIATDDFVFGSTQLANDIAVTTDDNRMFFDKSKGAFRAGSDFNEWDDAKVGNYSVALGQDTEASGEASFSVGASSKAIGNYSVAIGDSSDANGYASAAFNSSTQANGDNSFATGRWSVAESYGQTTIGLHPTIGTGNTNTYIGTDRLFVLGNGATLGSRSDALTILKNGNTTLNGKLTIDGDNQGAGTSYTLPAQDGAIDQVMTTDGSGNISWSAIPVDGDSDPTNEIELPAGGTNGQLLGVSALGVQWLDADEVVPDITNINNTSITTTALTVINLPTFSANIITGMAVSSTGWTKSSGTWRTNGTSGLHNNGSHFNISTGDFTAPVDGFYMFSAQVRIDGINTGYARLLIAINNSTDVNNGLHAIRNSDTSSASFDTMSVSGVVQLTAGDIVSVYVSSSNDTSFTIQGESGFNGYLINRL
ncbi:MAG: hypothetical protein HRT69_15440 [Flavobacteriaceae bacterium]|nr:hypothetical protein [Flavobacteriaceae bacterium]